jgi:hypothetical protein
METRIAKVLSVLFHPLIVPTYIFTLLLSLNAHFALILPLQAKGFLLGIILISTCIFPLLLVLLFKYTGKLMSLEIESRQERNLSLAIAGIFYYLSWWMLRQMHFSPVFQLFMIGTFYVLICTIFINLFWKISLYMVAAGGATGVLISLSLLLTQPVQTIIFITILVSGIIGFARLTLKTHNPAQVYLGWIVGLVVMLSVMNLF